MTLSKIPLRPLAWIGSAKKDYLEFPAPVRSSFGYELHLAQTGEHPMGAKPLRGIGGGVLELTGDFDGDTFRAVYAVRFKEALYVLHAFKKKSKRRIATPKPDIELIERRLKMAMAVHAARFGQEKKP
jgi:phage-related protein